MNPEILTPPLLVDSAGNPLLPLKKKPRNGTVVWVDGQRCVSIPVGRRGKSAIIDLEDFAIVGPYHWCESVKDGICYVFRYETVNGKRNYIYLHRMIIGPAKTADQVDHKNGNGLDNRRCNLRLATYSQNQANRKFQNGKTKGVQATKSQTSPWIARIRKDGKIHNLGVFATVKEAALAYDKAAREMFGEFARLNFPDGSTTAPAANH